MKTPAASAQFAAEFLSKFLRTRHFQKSTNLQTELSKNSCNLKHTGQYQYAVHRHRLTPRFTRWHGCCTQLVLWKWLLWGLTRKTLKWLLASRHTLFLHNPHSVLCTMPTVPPYPPLPYIKGEFNLCSRVVSSEGGQECWHQGFLHYSVPRIIKCKYMRFSVSALNAQGTACNPLSWFLHVHKIDLIPSVHCKTDRGEAKWKCVRNFDLTSVNINICTLNVVFHRAIQCISVGDDVCDAPTGDCNGCLHVWVHQSSWL